MSDRHKGKHVYVEPGGVRRVCITNMLKEPHVQDQLRQIAAMRKRQRKGHNGLT